MTALNSGTPHQSVAQRCASFSLKYLKMGKHSKYKSVLLILASYHCVCVCGLLKNLSMTKWSPQQPNSVVPTFVDCSKILVLWLVQNYSNGWYTPFENYKKSNTPDSWSVSTAHLRALIFCQK